MNQKADCDKSNGTASPEAKLPRELRRAKPWEDEIKRVVPAVAAPVEAAGVKVPRRWDRLVRLVGDVGIRRLLGSHVMVVGLGGVGSYVTESLARSAIGRLTLVDFDDVCVTNVNRQLQAFPATVGQSKAKLLAERVKEIHPEAVVEPIQSFYEPSNSTELLSPKPDFVVDAIDNVYGEAASCSNLSRTGNTHRQRYGGGSALGSNPNTRCGSF